MPNCSDCAAGDEIPRAEWCLTAARLLRRAGHESQRRELKELRRSVGGIGTTSPVTADSLVVTVGRPPQSRRPGRKALWPQA